jgi:hypothetical protein
VVVAKARALVLRKTVRQAPLGRVTPVVTVTEAIVMVVSKTVGAEVVPAVLGLTLLAAAVVPVVPAYLHLLLVLL